MQYFRNTLAQKMQFMTMIVVNRNFLKACSGYVINGIYILSGSTLHGIRHSNNEPGNIEIVKIGTKHSQKETVTIRHNTCKRHFYRFNITLET